MKKIAALRFVILSVIGIGLLLAISFNPIWPTQQTVVVGEAQFNATTIEQSTVLVHIGNEGEGSGVIISPHMILTAKHCVAEYMTVVLFDGTELTVKEVFVFDDRDVAVLFVDENLPRCVKAGKTPQALMPTWIYARLVEEPEGTLIFGWTRGIVSVVTPEDRYIILDQAIYPGMSGGGVYNRDGELVGLVVAMWMGPGHISLIEPIEPVIDRMVELGLGK